LAERIVQGASYEEEDWGVPDVEDFMKAQSLEPKPVKAQDVGIQIEPTASAFEPEYKQAPVKTETPKAEPKVEPKSDVGRSVLSNIQSVSKSSEPDDDDEDEEPKKGISKLLSGFKKLPELKSSGVGKLAMFGVIVVILILGYCLLSTMGKDGKNKNNSNDEIPPTPTTDLFANIIEQPVYSYPPGDTATLRANGYTGAEIEDYAKAGVSVFDLVQQAQEERQKIYDAEIKPYLDGASEEFKALAADTWVGQSELTFSEDTTKYRYFSETHNVDYEKLPARGSQLFVKLELDVTGEILFMQVTPERYVTLRDSGNIVVTISLTKTGDGKRVITSIKEVSIE